jgi:hypothetical protein
MSITRESLEFQHSETSSTDIATPASAAAGGAEQ